jgi:hypothetical protein
MLALRDAREVHDVLAIVARALARDFRRPCTGYELRDGICRPVAASGMSGERSPFLAEALDLPALRLRVLVRRGTDDLFGISSDGQLRAVLILEDARDPLDDEDVKYLRALAAHVSLALGNALAFEQLRRYAAEGAALTDAARTILGFTALEPLALALCRLCTRLVVAERVAVYARRGEVFARIAFAAIRPGLLRARRIAGRRTLGAHGARERLRRGAPRGRATRLSGARSVRARRTARVFAAHAVRQIRVAPRSRRSSTLAALAIRNVDLYEESTPARIRRSPKAMRSKTTSWRCSPTISRARSRSSPAFRSCSSDAADPERAAHAPRRSWPRRGASRS